MKFENSLFLINIQEYICLIYAEQEILIFPSVVKGIQLDTSHKHLDLYKIIARE